MFNYNIQDPCNNSHCPVVFFLRSRFVLGDFVQKIRLLSLLGAHGKVQVFRVITTAKSTFFRHVFFFPSLNGPRQASQVYTYMHMISYDEKATRCGWTR